MNPTLGFEHVKGYAGFAAGKPRVCSEHVQSATTTPKVNSAAIPMVLALATVCF